MPFSAAMGLIGSLVDSVLGAVLQVGSAGAHVRATMPLTALLALPQASWYAPNRKVVLCGSNIAGQSDEQLQVRRVCPARRAVAAAC